MRTPPTYVPTGFPFDGADSARIYNAKAATTSLPINPQDATEGCVRVDGVQWLDLWLQVGGNDVDVKLWTWSDQVNAWTVEMAFGVNGSLTLAQATFPAQHRSVEVLGADWAFLQITGVGGAGTLTAHATGAQEIRQR